MGLIRDVAAAGISGLMNRKKRGTSGQGGADTADAGTSDSGGGSFAGELAKRAAQGSSGKRSTSLSDADYSVSGMGLSGSVPGTESASDFSSNARRKRSNGKDRG